MTAGVRPAGAGDVWVTGAAWQAGSRGTAAGVPGLAALGKDRDSEVLSVSCAAAGSCAAGGTYTDRRGHVQGFVVSQRRGRWGKLIDMPAPGTLNRGGNAAFSVVVWSVSCASAGSCAAGGFYTDRRGHEQGFVAVERHGRWGKAIEVPGLGALNTGRNREVPAGVPLVSCAAAGSCAAGGDYVDASGRSQGFVVLERNGRWGKAIEVPGLGALNTGGPFGSAAGVSSVSCGSAGSCAAGGFYTDASGRSQGFVADERNGRWGTAIEVPGLGALNTGVFNGDPAGVRAVSCASAGSCAAGGSYAGASGGSQGFVVVERNGRWGTAIEVPGLGALNTEGIAGVSSVSCPSAGSCAAGGYYTGGGEQQGFVAVERHGAWGQATDVPGLMALNEGDAAVGSVSCTSAGNCAAAGFYGSPYSKGFVVSEKNGVWGKAINVPGLTFRPDAGPASVSCASPGNCAVVGSYEDRNNIVHGFVAIERHGRWGTATEVTRLTP
jgi:hypothetical protein